MQHSPEDGRVADAVKGNWVDQIAPPWSRPYLRLSRADRPAGTWLLFIPCIWGAALAVASGHAGWSLHALWVLLGCGIGAFLMRGAGCTWNDLTDQEFDAQVARTKSRPLPSGQVSRKQAKIWMAVQVILSAIVLLTFYPNAIILGIASLIPVMIYPFAKRFTWWPQVFLGIAFNWGALLGWAAIQNTVSAAAIILYAAGISWTLFYDTIYAHQDKEDDALIGVKSTARLFGTRSKPILAGFGALTIALMVIACLIALSGLALWLSLAGCALMAGHLFWQLRVLDIDDPDNCLGLFRANMRAGLLPAIGMILAGLF